MSISRSQLACSRPVDRSPRGHRSWTHHQTKFTRHHSSVELLSSRLRAPIQTSDSPRAVFSWNDPLHNNFKTSLQAVFHQPVQNEENTNDVPPTLNNLLNIPSPVFFWGFEVLLKDSMKQIEDLVELLCYTPAETDVLEELVYAQYISIARPSKLRQKWRQKGLSDPYNNPWWTWMLPGETRFRGVQTIRTIRLTRELQSILNADAALDFPRLSASTRDSVLRHLFSAHSQATITITGERIRGVVVSLLIGTYLGSMCGVVSSIRA